jgi:hypothetical protein
MPSSPTKPRVVHRIVTVLFYLGLVVADVALTNWDVIRPESCGEASLATRMWYQRVVTMGYRKPKPHFVRVVTVVPSSESGACGYRQLLAGILRKLDKLRIGSVVLDYSFSPRECKDATGELQDAIDQLAEHNVPVVYGQRTYTAEELEGDPRLSNELGPLKAAGFKNDDRGAMAIGYCAFSWAGVRRIISAGLRHTPSSYHLGRLPKKF